MLMPFGKVFSTYSMHQQFKFWTLSQNALFLSLCVTLCLMMRLGKVLKHPKKAVLVVGAFQ